MKNAIVLILLTSLSIKQSTDYSGTWVNSGDKFENEKANTISIFWF